MAEPVDIRSGYVRYPFMRQNVKSCLRFLSDEEQQRRIIIDQDTDDPWAHVALDDAINDLDFDDPAGFVGIVYRNLAEADAMRQVIAALEQVLGPEGMRLASDSETISAPSWPTVISTARLTLELMDADDTPPPLPSVDLLIEIFEQILSGQLDADEVSNWTGRWIWMISPDDEPLIYEALHHLLDVPTSGPGRTVARDVVEGWLADLREGRRDYGLMARDALKNEVVRDGVHAYMATVEPRHTNRIEGLAVDVVYWAKAGLPGPTAGTDEFVRQRLVHAGFPEAGAARIAITFSDYGNKNAVRRGFGEWSAERSN